MMEIQGIRPQMRVEGETVPSYAWEPWDARVLRMTPEQQLVSLCNRTLRIVGACSVIGLLAACTPPSEAARQRAMAPPPGPPGILASTPGDPSFNKLRCKIDGPDTICKRDTE